MYKSLFLVLTPREREVVAAIHPLVVGPDTSFSSLLSPLPVLRLAEFFSIILIIKLDCVSSVLASLVRLRRLHLMSKDDGRLESLGICSEFSASSSEFVTRNSVKLPGRSRMKGWRRFGWLLIVMNSSTSGREASSWKEGTMIIS
jgi:hypothetical protein